MLRPYRKHWKTDFGLLGWYKCTCSIAEVGVFILAPNSKLLSLHPVLLSFFMFFLGCDSVLFRKQSLCLYHFPCQSFTSPAWSRVGSDSFFSSKHMCTQWAVSHLMALHRNLYVGSWLCFVADAQCPSVEDSLCLSQDLYSECFKGFASESKWFIFFPSSLTS